MTIESKIVRSNLKLQIAKYPKHIAAQLEQILGCCRRMKLKQFNNNLTNILDGRNISRNLTQKWKENCYIDNN